MTSSEKFCLRWNDFESNISVAFRELREEKDFFDITLACEDSQVQAHKVILSACSPFFRNILRRNPHQHPLLYLKNVQYKDILSVLNFMYMGEVNIAQDELNTFLSVAEELQVKGLTQNNSAAPSDNSKQVPPKQETNKSNIKRKESQIREFPIQAPPKRVRHLENQNANLSSGIFGTNDDEDIQEVVPVKSEPREGVQVPESVHQTNNFHQNQNVEEMHVNVNQSGTLAIDDSYADEAYEYDQYGEVYDDGTGMLDNSGLVVGSTDGNKDHIESKMWKNSSGLWQCTDCDHTSQHTTNMRNHIEVKHVGTPGYYCQHCNKFCRTKNALSIHRTRYKH